MIHGTHGAYFNGGCRCPACKEAAHRYYVEVARPRREGERVEPKGAEHPLVAYAGLAQQDGLHHRREDEGLRLPADGGA